MATILYNGKTEHRVKAHQVQSMLKSGYTLKPKTKRKPRAVKLETKPLELESDEHQNRPD